MPVSPSFRAFVLDQLGRVAPGVRARNMFGGVSISSAGRTFALIADDVLYFKVDDENRGDFEAHDLGPFRPYGEDGGAMQYYEVPEALLEDTDALEPWVRKAIDVARRTRRKRPR